MACSWPNTAWTAAKPCVQQPAVTMPVRTNPRPGSVAMARLRSMTWFTSRMKLEGLATLISVLHCGHLMVLLRSFLLGFSKSATQSRRHCSCATSVQAHGDRHVGGLSGASSV